MALNPSARSGFIGRHGVAKACGAASNPGRCHVDVLVVLRSRRHPNGFFAARLRGSWLLMSTVPLLLAAASVDVIHMSAPDHWATLVVLGHTSGWNRSRLTGMGAVTAAGHVTLSVLWGFAVVALGLYTLLTG